MIEKIVNLAGELNETHKCGLDAAFQTAALMEIALKIEEFLSGPCCVAQAETPGEKRDENKDTPNREEKDSVQTSTAESQTEGATTPTPTPTPTSASPEKSGVTLDDLRQAVEKKAKAGHRDKIVNLLAGYQAKKVTEIAPEHYAAFLKQVEEIKEGL